MDNIKEVLHVNKVYAWAFTVFPSLLIYFMGLKSFVDALWLAGTFGGVIYVGVLPTLMYLKAKKYEITHILPHLTAYISGLIILILFVYSLVSLV